MDNLLLPGSLVFLLGLFFMWTGKQPAQKADKISIIGAAAHWVSVDRLIWEPPSESHRLELRYDTKAQIQITGTSVSGGNPIKIGEEATLDRALADRFRHLSGRPAHHVHTTSEEVFKAVKGQIVAIAYDRKGKPVAATRVQFPGILDQCFFYDGVLGPVYENDKISLKLWAPTAQSVRLNLYDTRKNLLGRIRPDHLEMKKDVKTKKEDLEKSPKNGVWRFTGSKEEWDFKYYRFEITVYHPINNQIHTYEVTDPYSVSLSMDSHYSQIVDLQDDSLKPEGWDELRKKLPNPSDITVYEGHVRDFSIYDKSVPLKHRGKFMAFTHIGEEGVESVDSEKEEEQDRVQRASNGMKHLARLSEAGLTHLHLLPINDIATVIENPEKRIDIHHPYHRICEKLKFPQLKTLCERYGSIPIRKVFAQMAAEDPATEKIQKPYSLPGRMKGMAALDAYNWGYDPFHFNVPEGSYATRPEDTSRIIELRKMVQALDKIGLKLVVDVVYNHTFDSGFSRFSVLDRVVPGYYHRYDPDTGAIETSTCCHNTAAEHAMMEKFMIDSILLWAKQYKIDAFRFDLMGHHPRYVMEHIRDALATLTLEKEGVDGENIYIYGEGWNFGEVADNRIFDQATQFNMGGTGIGSFNDRSRDAIRGGNFSDNRRNQGFANGRYLFPNEDATGHRDHDLTALLDAADRIRVGLAGNLVSYPYINRHGKGVTGSHDWIGFAHQPSESVNYIDKHDNETLWDNTQVKLPLDMKMEDRVRIHLLSHALINYGQGIPFFQMGTDILRSKSLDRNSFDSGDWFNAIDFSLESHLWGSGLPPAWDNQPQWEEMRKFLRHSGIKVKKEHMQWAHDLFLEQLQIRYSSPLFRLQTAEQINKRVAFHNTGPRQEPGLIVMTISDGKCAGKSLDPDLDGILLLFNADIRYRSIALDPDIMDWEPLQLHPVQENGVDPAVKEIEQEGHLFRIPPLSAVVLLKYQGDEQGDFVCNK